MADVIATHHGYPCRHEAGPVFCWSAAGLDVRATREGLVVAGQGHPLTGDAFGRFMALLALASAVADYLAGIGPRGSIEPVFERLRKRADPP